MVQSYSKMLADTDRIRAFDQAIRSAVRPDDVVVDLGCGVGTYAIIAARQRARRVIGVEANPVIGFARQIAAQNGVEVEFIQADARDVRLPEPATLLIFEDFATGLLDGPAGKLLEWVRAQWMADKHRIMPQGARLYIAPITSPSARAGALPLEALGNPYYGLDLQPLVTAARNSMYQTKALTDVTLLAPPALVLEQPLINALPQTWSAEAAFDVDQSGGLDGVCLWFDLDLNEEISYSNHPQSPGIWGQMFMAAPQQRAVAAGDRLRFELAFQSAFNDGFWKWNCALDRGAGAFQHHFAGNTFAASPLTAQDLQQYDRDAVIRLTHRAKIEAFILSLVDEKRTMHDISAAVQKQFDLREPEAAELVLSHLHHRRLASPNISLTTR